MAAINGRRTHAHFADKHDRCGIGLGRRRGRIGVKIERRHENRIHGLFGRRGRRHVNSYRSGFPRAAEGGDLAGRHRRLGAFLAGARKIAGARGGICAKRFDLPAGHGDRAALRHNQTLIRELRLDAHGSARRENAHLAALIESHRQIARRSRNRNRRGNDRRRINREQVGGFQRRMNAAIIQRQRDSPGGLDQLEMRGTANTDRRPLSRASEGRARSGA